MKFLTVCINSIGLWLVYLKITCALGWFLWCWYHVFCWYPLFLLLSLLKLCLFSFLPAYLLLLLKFGLELYDELYELFLLLLDDLLKDLLKDPSADLFVDLVLIAFMSQSWNESSYSLIWVSIFVAFCSLHLPDAASTQEDSLLISIACVSPKNKQMAHNQVYNRLIGLRPSQHMLLLPSVQSAWHCLFWRLVCQCREVMTP